MPQLTDKLGPNFADASGKLISYQGENLSFNGFAVVVAGNHLTGQGTAGIAATTIYTVGTAGVFRFSIQVHITTAGSAGTYTGDLVYTNEVGSALTVASPTVAATGLGAANQNAVVFYAKAGTVIQYQVTAAGITGSPAYSVTYMLERLS